MSGVKEDRRKMRTILVKVGGAFVILLVGAVIYMLFFAKNNNSSGSTGGASASPGSLSPEAIEQRFDGKDPKGKDGPDSRCADPPPSQPVVSTQPPLMGPDGRVVGTVELRTSGICPVIWARVNWPNGSYDLPAGWSLHIRMHRPIPPLEKVIEYTSYNTSIYVCGNMLTTVRGCVYAEVYFSNAGSQTAATKTECVK